MNSLYSHSTLNILPYFEFQSIEWIYSDSVYTTIYKKKQNQIIYYLQISVNSSSSAQLHS